MASLSAVSVTNHASAAAEWSVVELQGLLLKGGHNDAGPAPDPAAMAPSLAGAELGTLSRDASDRPQLVIERKQLTGADKELKKPLLVLRRKRKRAEGAAAAAADAGAGADGAAAAAAPDEVEFEVVGVVNRKMLFNERPVHLFDTAGDAAAAAGEGAAS